MPTDTLTVVQSRRAAALASARQHLVEAIRTLDRTGSTCEHCQHRYHHHQPEWRTANELEAMINRLTRYLDSPTITVEKPED